jgi:hypothetical protein
VGGKNTISPRGVSWGARRASNQSVKVSRAKRGSGRRRSMPAIRSMSHRFGQERAIQFEIGARREPSQESLAMWPKSRFRSGRPFTE